MKTKALMTIFSLFFGLLTLAQTPNAFKYQAVVRNSEGDIFQNQNVGVQVSILKGSTSGTNVYSESHSIQTNDFGLIHLEIGNGTIVTGNFETINWGNDSYFVKIEADITGGSNYQEIGTNQLLSVPYSLHARQADIGSNIWNMNGNKIYYNEGNVGVGLSDPTDKLHVGGDVTINGGSHCLVLKPATNDHTYIDFYADSDNPDDRSGYIGYGSAGTNQLRIKNEMANGDIVLYPDGNVGIGTSSPTHTLSVNGTIRSKEVIVNTGWSDFVFEKDYKLMPLEDLDQYITIHKHLPEIPSAEEVEENGVSLGNMDSKLLQKIEELTLYVIDLKKENETLKSQIESIQNQINKEDTK